MGALEFDLPCRAVALAAVRNLPSAAARQEAKIGQNAGLTTSRRHPTSVKIIEDSARGENVNGED